MATTYWTGSTDGDWSDSGNWTNGVPANGDTAILPRTSTRSVSEGLSQGAVDLAVLVTEDGYAGGVGLSGSPLIIGSSVFKFYGSGSVYLQNDSAAAETIYVDSPNKSDALTLSGSAVTALYVVRGKVAVASGMSGLTTVGLTRKTGGANDGLVEIQGSVTVTTLYQNAGRYTSTGTTTTIIQSGGTSTTTGTSTTLYLAGGVCEYEGATLTTAHVLGGLADFTTTDNVQTVTSLYIYPGGRCLYDPDIVTVTTVVNVLDEIGVGPVP